MRMFNKRITCRLLACLLFFNCLPALLFAQGTQAIITGTVVDNKGESVIGATIQVKNESTGFFTRGYASSGFQASGGIGGDPSCRGSR